MSKQQSKGEIEMKISEAMVKFEKDYMGRGPTDAKTYVFDDIIFVRLKGVLTKAELQLAAGAGGGGEGEKNLEGRELIKKMRQTLIEKARPMLESLIKEITGNEVLSLHTDISTKTGERIIIFTLK